MNWVTHFQQQINIILTHINILHLFFRVGAINKDVFHSILDSASAAKKMGEIIAEGRGTHGGGTTCAMHSQELCLKHAMGLVVRRRGGKIVDSFEEGKELRYKGKKLASTLMDKKCKKWFHKMVSISQKVWNMKALNLVTPNETRVGGIYNMFVSILRVKPLLDIMLFKAQNDAGTKVYRNVNLF